MKKILLIVVALVAVQCVIEFALITPWQQKNAQIAAHVKELQNTQKTQTPAPAPLALQLDQVLQRLPEPALLLERVQALHRSADKSNVVLRKVTYRDPEQSDAIARHEMLADVVGTYPAVRQFLRLAHNQDPAVAIEAIEITRPSMGSTFASQVAVRAQVRLALYSRPTP